MFGEFVRQWCRLVFWWVPTDQKHQNEQRDTEPKKRTEPATTQSPPAPAESAPEPSRATTSPQDDLTVIKGIGPTMDKRLRAMGIRTFADLAAADAQQVARKLNSRPVTAARVGEWIAEAKKRS